MSLTLKDLKGKNGKLIDYNNEKIFLYKDIPVLKYWNNTQLLLSLRPSTIKGAGLGLFSDEKIIPKGCRIGFYVGKFIEGNDGVTDYSFQLDDDWSIDSFDYPRCYIAMVNDVHKTRFKTNAEFEVLTRDEKTRKKLEGKDKLIILIASRDIKKDEEIFASYGDEYWKYR